ncbi:MAG: flagellar biosynthesis protein FliQ [Bacillota bacterium]
MDQNIVIDIGMEAIQVALLLSAPILLLGLLVGLIISIVQATTQIQEPTLSFIPKIVAISLALLVFGPWMMNIMNSFTIKLIQNIPSYIK